MAESTATQLLKDIRDLIAQRQAPAAELRKPASEHLGDFLHGIGGTTGQSAPGNIASDADYGSQALGAIRKPKGDFAGRSQSLLRGLGGMSVLGLNDLSGVAGNIDSADQAWQAIKGMWGDSFGRKPKGGVPSSSLRKPQGDPSTLSAGVMPTPVMNWPGGSPMAANPALTGMGQAGKTAQLVGGGTVDQQLTAALRALTDTLRGMKEGMAQNDTDRAHSAENVPAEAGRSALRMASATSERFPRPNSMSISKLPERKPVGDSGGSANALEKRANWIRDIADFLGV